jgi:hypothetical protein
MISMRIKAFSILIWTFTAFLPMIANEEQLPKCSYWVAPAPLGDDNHSGTYNQPWATLEGASKKVLDDTCTVWFFPGVYEGGNRINRRFTTPTTFRSLEPYRAELQNSGVVLSISGGKNIILDGFNLHQSGPDSDALVIYVDHSDKGWSEDIVLRNNIIHDSYNNDLMKIYDGVQRMTVQNNIIYNQGPPDEQMDVNGVTDVVIQDNIFFNCYECSNRINTNESKQYIVIKDSNEVNEPVGSQRITVRRNIFLNWQGQNDETIIQVGLDGKPYHEAIGVRVENNLIVGNSPNHVGEPFGVRGAKDVEFVNNTVVGDLPSDGYAAWVTIIPLKNKLNENISFRNNIWSDPTGTMGNFADGYRLSTINLVLDNNLYWNGGNPIPPGELFSPLVDDRHRIIGQPYLNENYTDLVLPYWTGTSINGGSTSIREEFIRLVNLYGAIPPNSAAVNKADPSYAPTDDILGRTRSGTPDLGAFEYMLLNP